jgi:ketosteroid isomerase-like protein
MTATTFWTRIPIMMMLISSPTTSTTAFIMVARNPTRLAIRQEQSQSSYYIGNNRINSILSINNSVGGGDNDLDYDHGSVSAKDNTQDDVILLPLLEAELVKLKASVASATTNEETLVKEGLLDDDDDDDDDVPISSEISNNNNNKRIQELEEKIDNARTAAEFGIRKAQTEFYDAFSNQNFKMMEDLWSHSDDVCCVHPGMESLQGYDDVIQSWKHIFVGFSRVGDDDDDDDDDIVAEILFNIEPSRVKIDICGRTAICKCVEKVNGGKLEALNIYRREDGRWRMTMHMASPTVMRSGG